MANRAGPTDTTLRPWLAILIVMTSIIGIVLASIIAIVFAPAADRPDMTRLSSPPSCRSSEPGLAR